MDFIAPRLASFLNLDAQTLVPTGRISPVTGLPTFIDTARQKDAEPVCAIRYFCSYPFLKIYRLTSGVVLIRRHSTMISYANAEPRMPEKRGDYAAGHRPEFVKIAQVDLLEKAFMEGYDGPIAVIELTKKNDFTGILRTSPDASRIPVFSAGSSVVSYDRRVVRDAIDAIKRHADNDLELARKIVDFAARMQWPLKIENVENSRLWNVGKGKEKKNISGFLAKVVVELPRSDSPEFAMVSKLVRKTKPKKEGS
ncbi:MAG: hypothetical protein ING19_16775 [Azospirillum sp.]|nr:hypothetical protein [Azospirillum sp.]